MSLSKAIAYSFKSTTVGVTTINATEIIVTVLTGCFPNLEEGEYCYAVLSTDQSLYDPTADYETVKITNIDNTDPFVLTVVRDIESTSGAKEWASGTSIACLGTAVAYNEVTKEFENYLSLAGGTMTGDIVCNNNLITAPNFKDYSETLATATWDGGDGVAVIDLQNGNIHSVNITVPITDLTFINARAGAHSFTLKLSQGATLKAITWPLTAAQWSAGDAPTMAINKTYWITFITVDGGDNWNGFLAGEI